MLVCSVGDSPTGVRVRSPVAWIAGGRETELLKPIDKAIAGWRASHRAVMQVNPSVASKILDLKAELPFFGRRQHRIVATD